MALFDRWCIELEDALAAEFPAACHETKKQGRQEITYVSVHVYAYRLNLLVGPQGWEQENPIWGTVGQKMAVGVPVSILGKRKVNFGSEMEDHGEPEERDDGQGGTKKVTVHFGSAEVNAWAQAFKRTLAYGFGMGLYLYDKEGHARQMVAAEREREQGKLNFYLKEMGQHLDASTSATIGGELVPLRETLGSHWKVIRRTPVLARAYVREVETATGITLAEFLAHHRAKGAAVAAGGAA